MEFKEALSILKKMRLEDGSVGLDMSPPLLTKEQCEALDFILAYHDVPNMYTSDLNKIMQNVVRELRKRGSLPACVHTKCVECGKEI